MVPEPKASAPVNVAAVKLGLIVASKGQGCDRNREDNVPSSPPRTRPPRRSTTASKRWTALTRLLDDAPSMLSNNAAERAPRAIAVGRHNWTFAGSDEGGRRAAAIYLDQDRQAQRYRSAGLARLRPGALAGSSRQAPRRISPLELANRLHQTGAVRSCPVASSGTPQPSLEAYADADDVFVDSKRHRVYVSRSQGVHRRVRSEG
jgi:hypothetical protein